MEQDNENRQPEQPVEHDLFNLTDTETEESLLEKLSLKQAISRLPEKEATVIGLRYFHGLTQDRVSRILNVSQVQVSRIEKKALLRLKELLR